MAEGRLFKCPTCGSSLSPEGAQAEVKCQYCGNKVIVPSEFRQAHPPGALGANPINIVMNESGTSINVADLAALQPTSMNIVLGESAMVGPTNIELPASTNRWLRITIWAFVIIMVVSVVVPLLCSFLGIFAGLAGSFLPFLLK
jgi:DNA-directed RNA polymerase subunit RPC12/RpoP